MKIYTKTYLTAFGYDLSDNTQFMPCEVCHQKSTEIHHIFSRKRRVDLVNDINNLMAVCRRCHISYGDKEQWMYFLLIKHQQFLSKIKVPYSNDFFNEQFNKYDDVHLFI